MKNKFLLTARYVAFTTVLLAPTLWAQTPRYVVINLGTLGGNDSGGIGINNAGQVVGGSTTGDGFFRAALFSVGSAPQDLGTLGGDFAIAMSVNNAGQAVGGSTTSGGFYHAALFSVGSIPQDLGTLEGDFSTANSINNSGQVAGQAQKRVNGSLYNRAALLSVGSVPQDLGTLGGFNSEGFAINNLGQVAGHSNITGSNNIHAALFGIGSVPQDLGTPAGFDSQGFGINNSGQVTGHFTAGDFFFHAALFSVGNAPRYLGTLGGSYSSGRSINNSGQVAGSSSIANANGVNRAFVFLNDSSIRMRNLNELINPLAVASIVLEGAEGINDAGQVTGTATIDGSLRAYLATPFWRQVDATAVSRSDPNPAVPKKWGYVKPSTNAKSDMVDFGCALCSAASMARSVIALNSRPTVLPIMTPALLDSLLTAPGANGYSAISAVPANPNANPPIPAAPENYNNLDFARLHTILSPYAKIGPVKTIPVTSANVDAKLTEQIYTLGRRVVLKLKHFKNGVSGPPAKYHFVWVIGKEGTDWKLGDGGWKNLTPAMAIESLNAHMTGGFQTGTTQHTFEPVELRVFRNLDYTMPPNLAAPTPTAVGSGKGAVPPVANLGPLDGTIAAVVASAGGPVEVVLTDPQGRRLGHDQATGSDFAEIPEASYWTDEPLSSTSDDDSTQGGTTKQLCVPAPVLGTYTMAATGTATGPASVTLEFIGPGGATKRVQASFNINAGETSTQQIAVPTIGIADLAVTQSFLPAQAKVGTPLTFTVNVTNNGASTATAPTFTNVLPDGVNFVSAVSSSGTSGLSGTVVGGVLDDLASGASATVTITVIPKTARSLSNSAHIAGFETDPVETNNSAVMTTTVTTSVDDWRNLHFTPQELSDPNISGLTADAETDGVRNLVEYALNLDPKASDASGLPAGETVSVGASSYFAFSYTIPPGVTDVGYTVEASSDLTSWSSVGIQTVSQVNNPDDSQTVTVRDTTPLSQTTRKFMRLKVTKLQ